MRATPRVVIGICGSVAPKGRFPASFAAFGLFIIIPTGKNTFEYYIAYQKYNQSIHNIHVLSSSYQNVKV